MDTQREHLVGKTLEELQEIAQACGMPRFAGKQIAQWIYERRVNDIDAMTNLSKAHRAQLALTYDVG